MTTIESFKLVQCPNFTLHLCTTRRLGIGGYGAVYQGFKGSAPHNTIAVKVVPHSPNVKVECIQKELNVFKHLPPHPNIVKSDSHYLHSEKNCYILMQKCDCSLKNFLDYKKPFSEQQVLTLAYDIIQGYLHLDKHGFIHQDLKPGNILFKNGVFKLADFGLAILNQNTAVSSRQREGTLLFMSPERLKFKYTPTSKSDIFSLGVILFQALDGNHPYISYRTIGTKQYADTLASRDPKNIRPRLTEQFQPHLEMIYGMLRIDERDRLSLQDLQHWAETLQKHIDRKSFKVNRQQDPLCRNPFNYNALSIVVTERLRDSQFGIGELLESDQMRFKEMEKMLTNRRLLIMLLDKLARRLEILSIKKSSLFQPADSNRVSGICLCLAYKVANQAFSQKSPYLPSEWEKEMKHSSILEMHRLLKSDRLQILECLKSYKGILALFENQRIDEVKVALHKELILLLCRQDHLMIEQGNELRTMAFILKLLEICKNNLDECSEMNVINEEEIEWLEKEEDEGLMKKVYEHLNSLNVKHSFL